MKKHTRKKSRHAKRRDCVRATALAHQAGPIWPHQNWGMVMGEISGLPSHITGEYIKVPEGVALRALCRPCGGRHETIIDLRTVVDRGPKHLLAACQTAHSRVDADLEDKWIPGHLACSETPRQHHMSLLVQEFLDELEQAARAAIRAGDPVPGMIYLLDTAGWVYGMSIDDVPEWDPGTTKRGNALAARHWVMRERVRAQKIDVVAAVSIGEAWMTPASDEGPASSSQTRQEGLFLAVVTSTFGQWGVADIQRAGGVVGEGRGMVDPLVWSGLGPCPLLDTLLATTDRRPRHPGSREWGAKIRVRG